MEELSQQFTTAQKGYQEIESSALSSSSQTYQQQVRDITNQFASVAERVDLLHVFSTNEEMDDIASDHIKYILTPYYQAELQIQVVDSERLDRLTSAKGYFARFLQHCESLKLIHKDDVKALYNDNTENPTDRRATLIARTKREKEIRVKMEELQKQMLQSTVADEELQRNNWIAIVNHNIIKAISQVESTEREMKMLEFAAQRPPDQPTRDSRGNIIARPSGTPLPKPVAYTILPGGQSRFFKLLLKHVRRELASQVFRPGFNMATVTPEQAYEAEVRAGRMVKGGGNDKKGESDEDEDKDGDDEDKLRKARAWDDFKDDHPYGSGNSKRS